MVDKSAFVTDVRVGDFMRRDKNYVYIIETTWSDATQFEIYRRYADFFSLQSTLLQLFPVEGGKIDATERVIPSLPTIDNILKILGRTNSESVMQSRLQTINHYCQTILMKLDPKISRSRIVLQFFRPIPGDRQLKRLNRPASLHPQKIPAGSQFEEHIVLADYQPEKGVEGKQLSAKAGETVLVLCKDKTGWCMVSRASDKKVGWLPESFLRKPEENVMDYLDDTVHDPRTATDSPSLDSGSDHSSSLWYHTIAEYSVDDPTQLSFPEGARILVIDQDEDGWWFVSYNGREGWAPSSFLEPDDTSLREILDDLDKVQLQVQVQPSEEDKQGDGSPNHKDMAETYYTKMAYTGCLDDEISFPKDAAVEVLHKSVLGWWTVKYNGQVGLAPATFLSETPPDAPTPQYGEHIRRGASRITKPPPRKKTVRQTFVRKKAVKGLPLVSTNGHGDGKEVDAENKVSGEKISRRQSPVVKQYRPLSPHYSVDGSPMHPKTKLGDEDHSQKLVDHKLKRRPAVRDKTCSPIRCHIKNGGYSPVFPPSEGKGLPPTCSSDSPCTPSPRGVLLNGQ